MTEDVKNESKAEPDLRLIRSLAHPLRHRILQALNLRVASPSELAEELELPLPNVAYHVKVLAQNDAIELVKTEPVRGALEHFYRATMRPWWTDEVWAELPVSTRRAIFGEILSDIWTDINAAAEAHELDHPTTQITRTWLELDDEAYEQAHRENQRLRRVCARTSRGGSAPFGGGTRARADGAPDRTDAPALSPCPKR